MGILTNEKQRNRIVKILVQYNQKLSVLMYIGGLCWFLALAYQPFNADTYFSENALLPGLVETELPSVLKHALEYKETVKVEANKDKKTTLQKWIFEQFTDLGLDTYRQNFSVVYPFKSISSQVIAGENVYSILRARRGAHTEALVLSVPLRPVASTVKMATGGSIALALALAREFKQKPYWAKDIIFLFTDFDEVGTMAWLDGYHQTKSEYILAGDLKGRSGAIQAAINLELPLDTVNYFNLRIEGLNGQLPNLDLVNLVVRLCRRERAKVAIHNSLEKKLPNYYNEPQAVTFEDYKASLRTMFRMMWFQASGAPSGNHGMFHKFHIEAITIQGIKDKKASRAQDLSNSGRIIEGIFRSLNNLLERFHQSFFFYLLPSTNRYISIGMYMPPFGLMAVAGLIKGIALWIECSELNSKEEAEKDKEKKDSDDKPSDRDEKEGEKEEAESREGEEEKEKSSEAPSDNEILEDLELDALEDNDPVTNKGVLTIVPIIAISLLLGWLACQGPELLMRIMPRFRIQVEDMVIYSMLAIFTSAVVYPKLMIRKSSNPNRFVFDWRLLKSVALIVQSLALASISLMNFSQAFFLAAFMVPVTTFVQPCKNRFLKWFQSFLLLLVSPFMLMFYVGLLSAWPQPNILQLLMQAFADMKELVFLSLMDSYLFNAWTEVVITAVIFPIWLFFWAIPWAEP